MLDRNSSPNTRVALGPFVHHSSSPSLSFLLRGIEISPSLLTLNWSSSLSDHWILSVLSLLSLPLSLSLSLSPLDPGIYFTDDHPHQHNSVTLYFFPSFLSLSLSPIFLNSHSTTVVILSLPFTIFLVSTLLYFIYQEYEYCADFVRTCWEKSYILRETIERSLFLSLYTR